MPTAKELLRKSTKAVCGISERQVVVKKEKLYPAVRKLEKAGFHVIGTSWGKTPTKKVWFIRGGGL